MFKRKKILNLIKKLENFSPLEISDEIISLGITGIQMDIEHCPLAKFFDKVIGGEFICCSDYIDYYGLFTQISYPLSRDSSISKFLIYFDKGDFPLLIK